MKQSHRKKFIIHVVHNLFLGGIFITIALYIGMLGYRTYEGMSWVDAFANASMILSGMGPLTPLVTNDGKLFAGCYALFSGLAFIVFMGLIFSPMIHHFFRRIHLENRDDI